MVMVLCHKLLALVCLLHSGVLSFIPRRGPGLVTEVKRLEAVKMSPLNRVEVGTAAVMFEVAVSWPPAAGAARRKVPFWKLYLLGPVPCGTELLRESGVVQEAAPGAQAGPLRRGLL